LRRPAWLRLLAVTSVSDDAPIDTATVMQWRRQLVGTWLTSKRVARVCQHQLHFFGTLYVNDTQA